MKYQDYYETMGVDRTATAQEIRRAYQKLARKYHPDVSKEADAEARFKAVGEAYAVLKDPEKRAAYDQLGANWKAGQDFQAPPGWNAGFEFRGGDAGDGMQFDASDFFDSLFGRGFGASGAGSGARSGARSARSRAGHARDHHAKILIDIEDAWQGGVRRYTLQLPEVDQNGQLQMKQHVVDVRIPKGVKQGQHLRLSGMGEPEGTARTGGDLYLEVEFKPHPLYRAEGHDLYMDLPVAPWEAALGAKIKVPTPAGAVELKVPAGSATGGRLRLKGRGLPGPDPGDLYAILRIAVPPANSDKARAFYARMKEEFDFNPRSHLGV
jgi:curved DNA-binding protein